MPYGRRATRYTRRPFRSRYPRVSKRTGRKIVKSYLRKKSRKGNTSVFKLKYNLELTVANLKTGVYGSLTNPTQVVNGTGTVNDWASLPGLFDSYRVCAVKLSFIPYSNVGVQDPANPNTALGYWPLYHAIDYNNQSAGNTGTITIPSDLDEYENCKMYNMYRPLKRYMRVPKYTSNPRNDSSFTSDDIPVTLQKGNYFDITRLPSYGAWYLKMQDTSAEDLTQGGKLRVTMYCAFKNRL